MAEFTKEQLIAAARVKAHNLSENIALIDGVESIHLEQTAALIEIALAALTSGMEQEPVAEISQAQEYDLEGNLRHQRDIDYYQDDIDKLPVGTKLYAAPQLPQPAVAITQHFDTIALDTAKMIMCDVNRRHEFLGGDVQLLSRIQCRIDDACRAAMLQGAEPVQGWIPCSERMPEEVGRYWCYVEEQNSLGKSHYQWNCSWNGDRWWVESENVGRVTHWMPLQAAPQQEVK